MVKNKIKTLIVEDNPGDTRIVRELLGESSEFSFSLDIAENLSKAEENISANIYDILLLDLNLPDSSGLATLSAMQNIKPKVPKIILTGLSDQELAVKALKTGAQDYLVKGELSCGALVRSIRYSIERKAIEIALMEKSRLFETVCHVVPVGIFRADKEGKYVYANNKWAAMADIPYEQMLDGGWITAVHPEDRRRVSEEWDTSVKKESSFKSGYRLLTSGGTVKWVIAQAEPEKNEENKTEGYVGAVTDVTGLKIYENMANQSEKKFQNIFENAVEGIYQSTPKGTYLNVNPAFAKMYGYSSPEEMVAEVKNIKTQLYADPKDREKIEKMLETEGIVKGYVAEFKRKDGRQIWVSINSKAVKDAEGKIAYYEGTTEEVTEKRKSEQELKKRIEDLETFKNATVGRELKMVELKNKIAELEKKLNNKQ